jgi:methylenetetrahydrofolate reductase (NADPH)
MQFNGIYGKTGPVISFEVFPPKTEPGLNKLKSRLGRLRDLGPSFVTVTHGAFGSDQHKTLDIARMIQHDLGQEAAHHLTCVRASRSDIDRALDNIEQQGIENIVALRGDPPQGQSHFEPCADGFRYANELVEYISRRGRFGIAVAGYPEKHIEARDFETDLRNLKRKVDAGADLVLTQLFYDNRHFYRFLESCHEIGINKPIVPGLLPIINVGQIRRITQLCGASLPQGLVEKLDKAGDDQKKIHDIGIEHTVRQAVDLLENGADGIHFYVLNRYFHIAEVMKKIRQVLEESRPGSCVFPRVRREGLAHTTFPEGEAPESSGP